MGRRFCTKLQSLIHEGALLSPRGSVVSYSKLPKGESVDDEGGEEAAVHAKKGFCPPPKGYLPICSVADNQQRYLVKIGHLSHPLLADLLRSAAQEYGYSNCGPLQVACDVSTLESVLASLPPIPRHAHSAVY